jgi:hypothetical protein
MQRKQAFLARGLLLVLVAKPASIAVTREHERRSFREITEQELSRRSPRPVDLLRGIVAFLILPPYQEGDR